MNEKTQAILNDFYGLNGESVGVSEIAKKYDLDVNAIYDDVRNALLKVSKLLREEKKEETRKKEFYSMFEGVSDEQINQALETLDERRQDILRSYYGINGSILTMEAIGEKYSIPLNFLPFIFKGNLFSFDSI